MGRRPTAGRALAGAALAKLAAGLAIWGAASPALLVFAAALLGGLLGWLPDRRVYRPLRRLRDRMDRGERAALAASGSEQVDMLAAAIDRVTGELGRSLEEADVERRYLREILESMSDGVLVADRDRKGELSNPAFRALFSDCLARPHDSVLDLSGSPVLVDFLDRIAAAAKVVKQRVEGVAGHTLELRGRSLAGGRSVVVARDLSEQLRLDETRRALVANVSHELRTPLTAIRGYAENLREGAVDEPATAGRFLDRILAQCSRLEALLGDLLALSRRERDKPLPLRSGGRPWGYRREIARDRPRSGRRAAGRAALHPVAGAADRGPRGVARAPVAQSARQRHQVQPRGRPADRCPEIRGRRTAARGG